jgi:hypothetical protein
VGVPTAEEWPAQRQGRERIRISTQLTPQPLARRLLIAVAEVLQPVTPSASNRIAQVEMPDPRATSRTSEPWPRDARHRLESNSIDPKIARPCGEPVPGLRAKNFTFPKRTPHRRRIARVIERFYSQGCIAAAHRCALGVQAPEVCLQDPKAYEPASRMK